MPVKKFNSAIEAMQAISSIGQRSKVITLNDQFKVTICSLGAQDETESFVDCMNFWGQAFLYKHKIETLSRCITKVNDQEITSDITLDMKREYIGKWSQSLVDNLYMDYAKLLGDVDEFLDKIKLTAQTNVVGVRDTEKKKEEQIKKDEKEEDSKETVNE
jgi:hypothetical protein